LEDDLEGGEKFSAKYHHLFAISIQKKATMAEMRGEDGSNPEWNFLWRTRLFVWEEDLFSDLLSNLQGVNISQGEDEWC